MITMKTLKIFLVAVFTVFLWGCSEDIMDEINTDVNNATSVDAFVVLPTVLLNTAYTATGTDLAWYASAFIEHSAGQWAQHHDADRRLGLDATSHFNNHWNGMYDLLNMIRLIEKRCSPGGAEENNKHALGISQILMAYNLAILTDFWGDVPWSEAITPGLIKPKFDRQSAIYQDIFQLLEDGIDNLEAAIAQGNAGPNSGNFDYVYGGNNQKWIKVAYSLMARYSMRLSVRDGQAASKALAAIANGFESAADNFIFDEYGTSVPSQNPWYSFLFQRSHLCVSTTLFNIMDDRNDPRMPIWFSQLGDPADYNPAPPGEADRVQGGVYSESLITLNGQTLPTPMMTFHELKFIEAEAHFRNSPQGDYAGALQEAIEESFVFHGLTVEEADAYYTAEVAPLLATDALTEILTQKYIAMYEHEAMEAYHDYRRTGIPTLHNPNNVLVGFPQRYQYGLSEETSNPENFIVLDIYTDKVWWAGGDELAP